MSKTPGPRATSPLSSNPSKLPRGKTVSVWPMRKAGCGWLAAETLSKKRWSPKRCEPMRVVRRPMRLSSSR